MIHIAEASPSAVGTRRIQLNNTQPCSPAPANYSRVSKERRNTLSQMSGAASHSGLGLSLASSLPVRAVVIHTLTASQYPLQAWSGQIILLTWIDRTDTLPPWPRASMNRNS
eukprot:5429514-Prymnesium_polylepis.2